MVDSARAGMDGIMVKDSASAQMQAAVGLEGLVSCTALSLLVDCLDAVSRMASMAITQGSALAKSVIDICSLRFVQCLVHS